MARRKLPKIKSMRLINPKKYPIFFDSEGKYMSYKDWVAILPYRAKLWFGITNGEIGTFAKGDSVTITQVGKGK